jgi:DNA-binding transcriptional ArsR family regulator
VNAEQTVESTAARIAAAIGEPARARMLYYLLDGRARTSTELALIAEVSPSTASVHLTRLRNERLVRVLVQGKHRYHSLAGPDVAGVLEGLTVLAGLPPQEFMASTPTPLRAARTCYDHIAGTLGVALHDRLLSLGWVVACASLDEAAYELIPEGEKALATLGLDVAYARTLRRRFAFACVDWSERRPHLGGALGAVLLRFVLKRRWVTQEGGSRILAVTGDGRRALHVHLGLRV